MNILKWMFLNTDIASKWPYQLEQKLIIKHLQQIRTFKLAE
jgi:hypothetical protein